MKNVLCLAVTGGLCDQQCCWDKPPHACVPQTEHLLIHKHSTFASSSPLFSLLLLRLPLLLIQLAHWTLRKPRAHPQPTASVGEGAVSSSTRTISSTTNTACTASVSIVPRPSAFTHTRVRWHRALKTLCCCSPVALSHSALARSRLARHNGECLANMTFIVAYTLDTLR